MAPQPQPPPDPAPGAHPPPVGDADAGALLPCLLYGKRDPVTVYNAMQEIRTVSGEVVITRLTALIEAKSAETNAAMTAKFAEVNHRFAEVNGRLAAVEVQLKVIWALLIPMLLTVVAAAVSIALR